MVESTMPEALSRHRLCGYSGCHGLFTICVSCDRGQRYCSSACRAAARREQRSRANRRYQEGVAGREAHRKCQQRYRARSVSPPVTDQPEVSLSTPVEATSQVPRACVVCGAKGSWVDTTPSLPGEWRRRRRLKRYAHLRRLQKRALSRPPSDPAGVRDPGRPDVQISTDLRDR
jgi:hypothetical protein